MRLNPYVVRGTRNQAGFDEPTKRHMIVYASNEADALMRASAWKFRGEHVAVAGRCYF